jgi:lipopolysaccharide transport system ATP-binding protein
MNPLVEVQHLGKRFTRIHGGRVYTLQDTFVRGLFRRQQAETFWALRDVNFQICTGKMLGIIGGNGAGKTTLLRVLGGVIIADEGSIRINGRLSALIDLGTGFHSDLSARDNLFINAIISGLTRREARQQYDSIVSFAELEGVMDNPLRTFSSGMQLRLAFAIAIHIQPEILMVDEVLAVGDARFRKKCLQKIAEFKAAGSAIVLVSHDISMVREMCDEVLWLRQASIAAYGRADEITDQYVAEMNQDSPAAGSASGAG